MGLVVVKELKRIKREILIVVVVKELNRIKREILIVRYLMKLSELEHHSNKKISNVLSFFFFYIISMI